MDTTEWDSLIDQKISRVLYLDEFDEPGYYDQNLSVHFIEYGSIALELASGLRFLIENNYERQGLSLIPYQGPAPEPKCEISLHKDPIWSATQNQAVQEVICYPGHYFVERKPGKQEKVTITGTIELCFEHGARVFISNAGLDEEGRLTSDLFVKAIYQNRKIGVEAGLIPEV
ncbi:MAG TPA: hypothetical protein VK168_22240 [Saprospiraceae bacterium]|nr:hypothetical protein [Saprospiraceae bacterium]